MKHRRVWLFALTFVFFAALLAIILNMFLGEREPVYQGRTLTSWLIQSRNPLYSNSSIPEGSEKKTEAEIAVRQIGTNAIPWLLRMLRKKDWPFQNRWNDWVLKRNLDRWYIPETEESRAFGVKGFSILGAQAAPAIPELISLLDHKNPDTRSGAAESLAALKDAGKDAMKGAIPALVRHLKDPDNATQMHVTDALGRLRFRPELVIPALIAELQSTDLARENIFLTLYTVGEYRTNASSAVEILKRYATNSDSLLSSAATNALFRITNSTPNPH